MKRLTALTVSLLLLVAIVTPVSAGHYWKVKMSTPASIINSRSFNVEYTTLSVEENDDIAIEALQNGVSMGTKTTTRPFGDSGAFAVTVPADGTYQYYMKATSSIDGTQTTETKTVTIDTVVPAAPSYGGVVRNGNQYTLTFTAPSDGDASEVRIYSSTSPNFVANATTQVGVVPITPGETKTFTYTATSDAQRYHAIQIFDAAGNFSDFRNDANVVVTQGQPAGTTATTTGGNNPAGTVAGDTSDDSQVGDEAASTGSSDGDVMGAEDKQKDKTEASANKWLTPLLIALAALGAAYYWLYYRQDKTLFNNSDKPTKK